MNSKGDFHRVSKHTINKKYLLLKKYLNAYTKVVSNNFPNFYYIDGFSATGIVLDRNTGENIKGSPIIALELEYPFTDYIFVEIRSKRKKILEHNIKKYSETVAKFSIVRRERNGSKKVSIEIIEADINKDINSILEKVPERFPSLVFLDPEGLELDWNTVETCSKRNKVELLINFSILGISRNLDNLKAINIIKRFMPCKIESKNPLQILDKYRECLKRNFKYVLDKPVYSSKKVILYYLIFATNNHTGSKIMSSVMKRGEQKKLF